MYEDLVKALRYCNTGGDGCLYCPYAYMAGCIGLIREKAADAIEDMSRRETPMQVRTTVSTKRCPSCNKQLSGIGNIHSNYRFCRWCGQALDWTEPPKEET